jgi:hypothetical protein
MIDQPLEPLTIAFAIAIMAIGCAVQASELDWPFFVVPVLALVDQSFIPGPMLLAGVMLALLTAYRQRTAIDVPALRNSLASFCRETLGLSGSNPSYLDGLGARWQELATSASSGRVVFGLGFGIGRRTLSPRYVEPLPR